MRTSNWWVFTVFALTVIIRHQRRRPSLRKITWLDDAPRGWRTTFVFFSFALEMILLIIISDVVPLNSFYLRFFLQNIWLHNFKLKAVSSSRLIFKTLNRTTYKLQPNSVSLRFGYMKGPKKWGVVGMHVRLRAVLFCAHELVCVVTGTTTPVFSPWSFCTVFFFMGMLSFRSFSLRFRSLLSFPSRS